MNHPFLPSWPWLFLSIEFLPDNLFSSNLGKSIVRFSFCENNIMELPSSMSRLNPECFIEGNNILTNYYIHVWPSPDLTFLVIQATTILYCLPLPIYCRRAFMCCSSIWTPESTARKPLWTYSKKKWAHTFTHIHTYMCPFCCSRIIFT